MKEETLLGLLVGLGGLATAGIVIAINEKNNSAAPTSPSSPPINVSPGPIYNPGSGGSSGSGSSGSSGGSSGGSAPPSQPPISGGTPHQVQPQPAPTTPQSHVIDLSASTGTTLTNLYVGDGVSLTLPAGYSWMAITNMATSAILCTYPKCPTSSKGAPPINMTYSGDPKIGSGAWFFITYEDAAKQPHNYTLSL